MYLIYTICKSRKTLLLSSSRASLDSDKDGLSKGASKYPDLTVGDLVGDTFDFNVGGLDLHDSVSVQSENA